MATEAAYSATLTPRGEQACRRRPRPRPLRLTLLSSSALPTLLLLGLAALPTPARAACTDVTDCYGELFTRGIVTSNPDGSVQKVETNGGVGGINETVPGAVTGNQSGVLAVNANDGATSIHVTGDATGIDAYGIAAIAADAVTFADDGRLMSHAGGAGTDLIVTVDGKASGGESGILAEKSGTLGVGVTTVTAKGDVTGTHNAGIEAGTNGASLTIEADARVSGGNYGIYAENYGTGATSITAKGDVASTIGFGSGVGIHAFNDDRTTDLTVEADAEVSSGFVGLSAWNYGTGSTSVTAKGDVTGMSDRGIDTLNFGKNLTVEADARVSGGLTGVWASNRGSGATSVTAKGAVTGTDLYGVLAVNGYVSSGIIGPVTGVTGPNGTDLTVDVAGASGGVTGILAVNTGSGVTSVHASGDVAGTNGNGILAMVAGSVDFGLDGSVTGTTPGTGKDLIVTADADVAGGLSGIMAGNYGTGGLTSVTARGDVTSTSATGVSVYNHTSTTDLTVVLDGSVTGESGGIFAENFGSGATVVTVKGNVTGTGNTGIGTYGTGIYATNTGTDLTVTADAEVSGGAFGIRAWNYGTGSTSVTAKGDVTAKGNAGISAYIGLPGTGDLTVEADARVSGRDYGIYAYNRGSGTTRVTAGVVTGAGLYGAMAVNGEIVTDLYGVVTGIKGPSGTDLTVDVAGASGGMTGILAVNTGSGVTSVHASGDVAGTSGAGITAVAAREVTFDSTSGVVSSYLPGAGMGLTVTADARVTGASGGIFVSNYGTGATLVTASGGVAGERGYGIHAVNGDDAGNLTVKANAVSGGDTGIFALIPAPTPQR